MRPYISDETSRNNRQVRGRPAAPGEIVQRRLSGGLQPAQLDTTQTLRGGTISTGTGLLELHDGVSGSCGVVNYPSSESSAGALSFTLRFTKENTPSTTRSPKKMFLENP